MRVLLIYELIPEETKFYVFENVSENGELYHHLLRANGTYTNYPGENESTEHINELLTDQRSYTVTELPGLGAFDKVLHSGFGMMELAPPKHSGIRPYGPGKFSTILDSYVYSVSLDGGCDEELGYVSECGEWYGVMRDGWAIFHRVIIMLETLTTEEQEKLTSSAGVILREDSNGFISVTYYKTDSSLELAWIKMVLREDCAKLPKA